MKRIDLNCDLGEGAGLDQELMPLITSANIACGGHTGDDATMRIAIELALQQGVVIGAHPSLNDRENFGRRELPVSPREAAELVRAQIGRFQAVAAAAGAPVHHVKLHGALYNLAARDDGLATAIAAAIQTAGSDLVVYAPWRSQLAKAAQAIGLSFAAEVFADRTYQADGSLTPRTRADALIRDEAVAVAQVRRMIDEGRVRATDGTDVTIAADTVCLHGDGLHAVEFARRLRRDLATAGVKVGPYAAAGRL
jgi:UPF0271 protein